MAFFLFSKQIVDMVYQYQFLDYIMVGWVFVLLLYQVALVRPNFRTWFTGVDIIVFALIAVTTYGWIQDISTYQTYFKWLSAFLIYFVGRIYYDRIKESYGALTCSAYLIVYTNFLHRIVNYGFDLTKVINANGDYYYNDTDMAFAMVLALIFIAMLAKNSIFKLITIFIVCPYMVLCSDAGIQKVLMFVIYAVIGIYIAELIFRKRRISNLALTIVIIGILSVVFIIYVPVFMQQNTEMVLSLFDIQFLNSDNMHVRYDSWREVMEEWIQAEQVQKLFGMGLATGIPTYSLYIKIIYSIGYVGLALMVMLIVSIIYYVVKVKDRKTFYLTVMLLVLLLGTGVTVNSMESVQMSWFPMLFAGMVVSSVSEDGNCKKFRKGMINKAGGRK